MSLFHACQDKELALLIGGSRKAFEAIYHTYAAALINFAQKSIPTKEDCEEIVQEVFESLWAKHQTLHHLTSLRPYLFKMVKYKIVDYIRHSAVKKKYEAHYLLFARADNLTHTARDPAEIQSLIDKSVGTLPDRCQTAFRLRFDENLSYKDIAVHMNISTKTVEKHISAALHHLRNVYQDTVAGPRLR